MGDPHLAHLRLPCILWLFYFQTAWVLTSPGYSLSSLTSLLCSTLWTKWSVLLVSVPGILKTMVAPADLRWKGSPWMKLMSKSYPWDVLFCPDWLSAPSCSDDLKCNICRNDFRTVVKIRRFIQRVCKSHTTQLCLISSSLTCNINIWYDLQKITLSGLSALSCVTPTCWWALSFCWANTP